MIESCLLPQPLTLYCVRFVAILMMRCKRHWAGPMTHDPELFDLTTSQQLARWPTHNSHLIILTNDTFLFFYFFAAVAVSDVQEWDLDLGPGVLFFLCIGEAGPLPCHQHRYKDLPFFQFYLTANLSKPVSRTLYE